MAKKKPPVTDTSSPELRAAIDALNIEEADVARYNQRFLDRLIHGDDLEAIKAARAAPRRSFQDEVDQYYAKYFDDGKPLDRYRNMLRKLDKKGDDELNDILIKMADETQEFFFQHMELELAGFLKRGYDMDHPHYSERQANTLREAEKDLEKLRQLFVESHSPRAR